MSYKLRMSTVSISDKRNDLHLTTTGISHGHRDSKEFPPKGFKTLRSKPLPNLLRSPPDNAPTESDTFATTTGSVHYSFPAVHVFEQPLFKKAPSLLKVNHTLDTVQKLDQKPSRPPLTMGYQSSETHDRFRGQPDGVGGIVSHCNPLPPLLNDHLNRGPTQELPPTAVNRQLQGKPFVPQHQAIFFRNEPYMTTNDWCHRTFSKRELNAYPKKDVATYWQCEDYPKAWGFGMKENPLPQRISHPDATGPMIDRMVFKTRTVVPRQPQSLQPIPEGLRSHYTSTYAPPPEEKLQELFTCPVTPRITCTSKDTTLLQSVPNVYRPVNTTYGSTPSLQVS